jgi:predicted metal-binding protein
MAREALKRGATSAKVISARKVVVDPRVRLKCSVPLCSSYGANLMCPPNVISVDEFSRMLRKYKSALLIQVEADFDSRDKSNEGLSGELCREIETTTGTVRWQRELHRIVNEVETLAFKRGYRFAAGLIGGECSLCNKCAALAKDHRCVHPFKARPSMEALGIDVVQTCRNAGLEVHLSSKHRVRWTGLVLLE